MNILPYKLTTTNDQLTSRAGLLTIAQLMQSMQLGEHIDQQFPQPGSNRGFKPSALTKIDPPVLKIIDPPSAQFLRFTSSGFSNSGRSP